MKYKHKITGEIAEPAIHNTNYYVVMGKELIPKRFIEKSLDWEVLTDVLFVTADGVNVREGDIVWVCSKNYKQPFSLIVTNNFFTKEIYFSKRELAIEYMVLNSPVLSLIDIEETILKNSSKAQEKREKLRNIIKRKLWL